MRERGQAHVTAFNRRHPGTGTRWKGRLKSSLVDSGRYLLTTYRYIEIKPRKSRLNFLRPGLPTRINPCLESINLIFHTKVYIDGKQSLGNHDSSIDAYWRKYKLVEVFLWPVRERGRY